MARALTIKLDAPHLGQQRVIEEAKRFNVLSCGRRFGKTKFGIDRVIHPALQGYPTAWFAPTYRNLAEVWLELVRVLKPIAAKTNASEHRIELITNGVIECWSLEKADIIRGRKYKRAIIDEAGIVKKLKENWQQVIRPTLTDYEGDAWFLGTPKGFNYFYELFNYGKDPLRTKWASWQMPTSTNPFIPPAEIKELEQELPEKVYQQEILAQFLPDGGAVFRGVLAAATATAQERAIPGHVYVAAMDLGRKNDFSVIIIIDLTTSEVVYLERFTQIEFQIQLSRLQGVYDRFKPIVIIVEENNFGVAVIEQQQRMGLPIQAWISSNASKAIAVDALTLAFEQQRLRILNDPILIKELQSFEGQRLPSGLIRYAGPEDEHDDTVITLLMAWYGCCEWQRSPQLLLQNLQARPSLNLKA